MLFFLTKKYLEKVNFKIEKTKMRRRNENEHHKKGNQQGV